MHIALEMKDPLDRTNQMEATKLGPWIPVTPVKIGPPCLRKRATRKDENQSIASSERCGKKREKDDKVPMKQQTSPKSTVKATQPCTEVPRNEKALSPSNCPLLDIKKKAACLLSPEAMDIIVKGASDVETRKDKDVHQAKRKHSAEVGMRKARINLSWQWLSRPKVDIDYETMRAWTLLNEFGSEYAEKEIDRDIDKKRYWEEERKCFREQALSFVTKMCLIQGDRCFREWKGSVVDSVVGAFLTQNVSDKTSSSSFIALAAKFPCRKTQQDYHHICPESSKKKARTGVNSRGMKMCEDIDKKMYWESVRNLYSRGRHKEENPRPLESVDWEVVRQANTSFLANILIGRGMHDKLAERIQGFLDRLCRDHGSIDLEWLKNVPPKLVKQFLLTIEGLGLKCVECIRLLSLKQPAFPVDTNVGRIVVRLGWVPLQPMPEMFQLHLLQKYPVVNDIHKYLWPRLCHLDHPILYELHYQMITLGKVFCTKTQPNCNACPLRDECQHYASTFKGSSILPQRSSNPPPGAGSRRTEVGIEDIEDIMVEPKHRENKLLPEETRPPLVPKVKHNVSRMTFPVFELPDSHPLLEGLCRRELDDAYPYLLAIWKPGFLSEKNTSSFGNNMDRHGSDTVQGTILVPVRTALCGNFPLNGTYFQINEVLADDGSSRNPVNVQVDMIKNLTRRTLYCGASVLSICRGLSSEEVTNCFQRGYICIRGFDQRTRESRPLPDRFRHSNEKVKTGRPRCFNTVICS